MQFDTLDDWMQIYAKAGLRALDTETGPFEMMSPKGFLADEGFARSLAKAVPYLGYVLVVGHKPASMNA